LAVRARFFADHREGALRQGAQTLHGKAAELMDDGHTLGEIGEVALRGVHEFNRRRSSDL
jgi:ornithine cyclodeaminase